MGSTTQQAGSVADTSSERAIKPQQLLAFMAVFSWCWMLLSWAHRQEREVNGRAAELQTDGAVFASQLHGTACCKAQVLSKYKVLPVIYEVTL